MFYQRPFYQRPRTGAITLRRLIVGLAATLLLASTGGVVAAEPTPRLLLLPMVVHSSEDPAYLREGLSDMLSSRFDRIGALELIRADLDGPGATNAEDALKQAREVGADYVLYGSFTRFGKGASLDVQCTPVNDEGRMALREIFVHSGSIGDILPDLDQLAGKVSRFALGDDMPQTDPDGNVFAPSGASDGMVKKLMNRVDALEAEMAEMSKAMKATSPAGASN